MSPALRLRILSRADLPFADSVRALANWNQTIADWTRFLALEPDGCFLAEWNGEPAGTATTAVYGAELAWIGMLLVHPDFRRRGIGRALLERCVEHLRGRGVLCIKLDATPQGKPVYDSLGFKDEWTLTRWERPPVTGCETNAKAVVRNWIASDIGDLEALDTGAFGVSRERLVQLMAEQSRSARVLESRPGRIAGYGLLRDGSRALYLGPVVAESPDAARPIIEALVRRGAGERIYWDVPDQNAAAVAWAGQHGFTEQRRLTRMYLGENTAPGNPAWQFAIAGPEVG